MDDETPSSSDSEGIKIEDKILEEFKSKKPIKPIRFNQLATSFIVPAHEYHKERVVRLKATECRYKKLIFSMIYTAFYRTFVLDELPRYYKSTLHTYVLTVTAYLNDYDFEHGKEINFFKRFEFNANIILSFSIISFIITFFISFSESEDSFSMISIPLFSLIIFCMFLDNLSLL